MTSFGESVSGTRQQHLYWVPAYTPVHQIRSMTLLSAVIVTTLKLSRSKGSKIMTQEKELIQEPNHGQRKMFMNLNKRNKYHFKTWYPLIGTCNNVPLDKGSACKETMTLVSTNSHTASLLKGPLELNSSSLLILYSAWWVKWLQVCWVWEQHQHTHCALQWGFTSFVKWRRTNYNQTDHFSVHQHDMIHLPTETNLRMEVNRCISLFCSICSVSFVHVIRLWAQ